VRTGRLARMGSVFFLSLAVVACSSTATPSPSVVASGAVPPTPSAIPTSLPTSVPLPSATPSPLPTTSPRPMAPATIKPGPAMTKAREGHAAVLLADGRVLIMGGNVLFVGKCPMACILPSTASVEVYDPITRKFSLGGSLAEPRSDVKALLLDDGRVLVYGGLDYDNTIEIFDPARRASVVVKAPAGKTLPAAATMVKLADGRVLIAGGTYDQAASTSNVTLIFDPATGGFGDGPLMAKPRQRATATLLDDGRVLIAGGDYMEGFNGNTNDSVELVDPSMPVYQAKLFAPTHTPSSATLLADGRVLLLESAPTDSTTNCVTPVPAEIFDPRTDTFTTAGPMSTPRFLSTAIGIQDRRVIVLGGLDPTCNGVNTTVEAFDPDTATFQAIATEFPKITDFSATLLGDGEILIAGGNLNNAWSGMTTATWLLKP
jgi:hypothetical protein